MIEWWQWAVGIGEAVVTGWVIDWLLVGRAARRSPRDPAGTIWGRLDYQAMFIQAEYRPTRPKPDFPEARKRIPGPGQTGMYTWGGDLVQVVQDRYHANNSPEAWAYRATGRYTGGGDLVQVRKERKPWVDWGTDEAVTAAKHHLRARRLEMWEKQKALCDEKEFDQREWNRYNTELTKLDDAIAEGLLYNAKP